MRGLAGIQETWYSSLRTDSFCIRRRTLVPSPHSSFSFPFRFPPPHFMVGAILERNAVPQERR